MIDMMEFIAKIAGAPWYLWLAFFAFIGWTSFYNQMKKIELMTPDEKAEWMEQQRRKSLGLK